MRRAHPDHCAPRTPREGWGSDLERVVRVLKDPAGLVWLNVSHKVRRVTVPVPQEAPSEPGPWNVCVLLDDDRPNRKWVACSRHVMQKIADRFLAHPHLAIFDAERTDLKTTHGQSGTEV